MLMPNLSLFLPFSDDVPRVRRPGRYRTSSSLSTWSNVRTRRSSTRGGGGAPEDASAVGGSLGIASQTSQHQQQTVIENGVPVSLQHSTASSTMAGVATGTSAAPASTTNLTEDEKRETETLLNDNQVSVCFTLHTDLSTVKMEMTEVPRKYVELF